MFKVKPILVLTVIITIISTLLISVESQIKNDPNAINKSTLEKCIELGGEGEYTSLNFEDFFGFEKPSEIKMIIQSVPVNNKSPIYFEVVSSGYNKDGLTILIKADVYKKEIIGIKVISIRDTPGVGTKINNNDFLSKFFGVKEKPLTIKQVGAVTGATRSSEGVMKAVNAVIEVMNKIDNTSDSLLHLDYYNNLEDKNTGFNIPENEYHTFDFEKVYGVKLPSEVIRTVEDMSRLLSSSYPFYGYVYFEIRNIDEGFTIVEADLSKKEITNSWVLSYEALDIETAKVEAANIVSDILKEVK